MKLHAESPVLHAESTCILHAKEFLLYSTWPLIITLLRVYYTDVLTHVRCHSITDQESFCRFQYNRTWRLVSIPNADQCRSMSIKFQKECGASITCNAMRTGAGCLIQGNNCLILSLSIEEPLC